MNAMGRKISFPLRLFLKSFSTHQNGTFSQNGPRKAIGIKDTYAVSFIVEKQRNAMKLG